MQSTKIYFGVQTTGQTPRQSNVTYYEIKNLNILLSFSLVFFMSCPDEY